MDPDTTLKGIRAYIRAANENGLTLDEKFELIELIEALDEWLSKGGFLPSAWAFSVPPLVIRMEG
jgi:hypothetical protein